MTVGTNTMSLNEVPKKLMISGKPDWILASPSVSCATVTLPTPPLLPHTSVSSKCNLALDRGGSLGPIYTRENIGTAWIKLVSVPVLPVFGLPFSRSEHAWNPGSARAKLGTTRSYTRKHSSGPNQLYPSRTCSVNGPLDHPCMV